MTKVKWKDGFGANGPIEVTEYEVSWADTVR